MILSFLVLAQAVPAVPHGDASERPIVVTAQSVDSTRRALEACLARKCPPKEDIDASLAHAEVLFVDGDYRAARAVVTASRRRNARFAKTLPIEVADLSRANARMASVVGLPDVARINTIETVDALTSGLSDDDPRVLSERLSIGDSYAKAGRFIAARDVYRDVARRARAARAFTVEGNALFRVAAIYGAVATLNAAYRDGAASAVAAIERTTEPELAPFREGIVLLKARLASLDGDNKALDAAIVGFKSTSNRPMLLDAPPMSPDDRTGDADFREYGSALPQWADVAFWIASDGTVRDVVVLRQSATTEPAWLPRATAALAKRRYTALPAGYASPGTPRVERFSYVHDVAVQTGSRIRSRAPKGRLDIVDLTWDAPTAARPGG